MFRGMIRQSCVLEDPFKRFPLMGFDGTPLHPNLVNFYNIAKTNYNIYIKENKSELQPVFVTFKDEKEYNEVSNWTIAKIQQKSEKPQRNLKN